MKKCVLEEKACTDCGACDDRCMLDPGKICDNCFRCLEQDERAYAEIPIDCVILDPDGERDADTFDTSHAGKRERYVGEQRWHTQTIPGWHAKRRR